MTGSEAILGKEVRLNHRHTLQRGQDKVRTALHQDGCMNRREEGENE